MLKPSRKILRKEIKKDPILDSFEKIENGFEENRKTIINVLIFFIAIIITGSIYVNNQNDIELESSTAFGTALVALQTQIMIMQNFSLKAFPQIMKVLKVKFFQLLFG